MTTIETPVGPKEAAALIGRSVQWVHLLERRGFIKKVDRGLYRPCDVAQGALRSVLEDKRSTQHSAAATRLADVRTRLLEQRAAAESARLQDHDTARDFVIATIGRMVAEVTALPAMISRDPVERRRIEGMIDSLRHRVADHVEAEVAIMKRSTRR